MAIIGIAIALLVPALAPATGRSLEGAARQLTAELENARQIAIAERTRTRLLILGDPSANSSPVPLDAPLRAYAVVSLNKTANTWKQRGKWTRLSQPATFDPTPTVNATTEEGVIDARKTSTTRIDNTQSGNGATTTFTGAYIEFHSNGSTSLDPNSPSQILAVVDAIPDNSGSITKKNPNLKYRVAIDPLTGSARLQ